MTRIEQAASLPSKKKKQQKTSRPAGLPVAIRHWVIGGT